METGLFHNSFTGEGRMIAEDHESVLVSTDAHVLFECQIDARHTRVVCALAEERNGLTASPRRHGTSQAFVPHPEGMLVFGKVLVPRVQSTLRIPRTVRHKRTVEWWMRRLPAFVTGRGRTVRNATFGPGASPISMRGSTPVCCDRARLHGGADDGCRW